jgi:hypothetical protein
MASGSEEVHGTPWQVERHRVGDQVTLTLRHYGDQRWLWPLTIRPPVMLNVQGTITGPIERIDANAARVRLGGKVILAHPEQLRAFSLGERTTMHFGRVGHNWWLIDDNWSAEFGRSVDERESIAAVISPLFQGRSDTQPTKEDHQHW